MRPSGSLLFVLLSFVATCILGKSWNRIMDSPKRPGPTAGFAPLVPELDVFDF
jgi:hypothetical protein